MANENYIARANRLQKVLAMVGEIDAQFHRQFPGLDCFDQAGRIWQASATWSDKVWLQVAKNAGYKSDKTPGPTTRALIREVYEGRAKAPASQQVAS